MSSSSFPRRSRCWQLPTTGLWHPRKLMPTWAASHTLQQLTKSDGLLCTVYALKARTQQVPSVPFEVQEHGNYAVRLSSR